MLLIWAPFVLLARVAMGLHYLSDVIVGATLGVISGLLGVFILG
jgi:membrane-associated phospholipid phosphatase